MSGDAPHTISEQQGSEHLQALSYNAPMSSRSLGGADSAGGASSLGPLCGPPAEGLLGGNVAFDLHAGPRSLMGTIQIQHPNAAGTSVFHIHCEEYARVFETAISLHSQRAYMAFLFEFPLPSSFFAEKLIWRNDSLVARMFVLQDFDVQGLDHTCLCNLACMYREEVGRQPAWLYQVWVRLCTYLHEHHSNDLNEWRHQRMCHTVGYAGRWNAESRNLGSANPSGSGPE